MPGLEAGSSMVEECMLRSHYNYGDGVGVGSGYGKQWCTEEQRRGGDGGRGTCVIRPALHEGSSSKVKG